MEPRSEPIGVPRDFLAACLLLLLRHWSMHGYRLMQQLVTLGFAALDPGTVYRTLRQLERDGLIRSHWDLGEAGPARRTYELTEAGELFLRTWAHGLEQYRRMLDAFFRFYGIDVAGGEERSHTHTAASAEQAQGAADAPAAGGGARRSGKQRRASRASSAVRAEEAAGEE